MPTLRPRKRPRGESSGEELKSSRTKRTRITRSNALESLGASEESDAPPSIVANFDAGSARSSHSDVGSGDIDMPSPKLDRHATIDNPASPPLTSDDEDEHTDFEDVRHVPLPTSNEPAATADLELILEADNRISLTNPYGGRKGPTKLGRWIRNATHCLHVQFLLWHYAVRNAWVSDLEVRAIMMSHLPPKVWNEVDRWRETSRLTRGGTAGSSKNAKGKSKAQESTRSGGKAKTATVEAAPEGDPDEHLIRLLGTLVVWWKQRFRITAPGLRKWGYMDLDRIDELRKGYAKDPSNFKRFGERIASLEEFRAHAQKCGGSRDVGAQLFTALLRALGIEARMIASLQPLGFGWSRFEEADIEQDNQDMPRGDQSSMANSGLLSSKRTREAKKSTTGTPSMRSRRGVKRFAQTLASEEDEESLTSDEFDDSDTDNETIAPSIIDMDLEYPHVWTEVHSSLTHRYIPVDAIVKHVVCATRSLVESLEPRGAKADKARQVISYIVGYSPDGTAKDVTVRYIKGQIFPGRAKSFRFPSEKIPIYNRHGKVKRHDEFDMFKNTMRAYTRGGWKHPITDADTFEDQTDLKRGMPEIKEIKPGEETLQFYKTSKEFVLERHLKREEALKADATPVRQFRNKGSGIEENVYKRSDVVAVKSAETWHKQGRAPKAGEDPLKRVAYRAATTNRKREITETERVTGEKVLQGLYSRAQTDWIIPSPIENGVIPKNEYGKIDLFVEHMCPRGAAHVPYRGAVRVCKRLEIDFAEAVVGFEFGHRMAVPVIQGVVIAEEHYDRVMEELERDEREKKRKADEKRRAFVLGKWQRFLMGIRIVTRIAAEYGDIKDGMNVFGKRQMRVEIGNADESKVGEEDVEGGFLPEGFEEDEDDGRKGGGGGVTSSFFPVVDDDDDGDDDLVVDHG